MNKNTCFSSNFLYKIQKTKSLTLCTLRSMALLCIFFCSHLEVSSQNSLQDYINAAKQNSPLINDNLTLSKINQIEAERLKNLYTKPQIGISANYLYAPIFSTDDNKIRFEPNSNGADKYFGYDLGATNGGQYQALANITYPLYGEKRFQVAKKQIDIGNQINQNNSKLTAHDIEKVVTDQYLLCLLNLRQVDYINSVLSLFAEQRDILQKLVKANIYKQADLILLNIEAQNFNAQKATFNANYMRDLMDLNILCGINDTSIVQLRPIELNLSDNIKNSAFLEKYRLDSLNLVAVQNVFELKYKPQINVFANSGLNGVYLLNLYRRMGYSAGISVTMPLYDGNQKALNKSKSDVFFQSFAFTKQNFLNQNAIRRTKILTELQSYSDRILFIEEQLKEYDTLLSVYKKEIITGQLSIVNYLTTLKNKALMQRDLVLLSAQKQALINTYNYWNW